MVSHGRFGPRGAQVTVASVDWTYANGRGLFWACPAPTSVLGARSLAPVVVEDALGRHHTLQRDIVAESDAFDALRDTGLRPLPEETLQWRAPALARQHVREGEALWSLPQEDDFADFWADTVPQLQARGWRIVVRPGFAHQSVPVSACGWWCGPRMAAPWGMSLSATGSLPRPRCSLWGHRVEKAPGS